MQRMAVIRLGARYILILPAMGDDNHREQQSFMSSWRTHLEDLTASRRQVDIIYRNAQGSRIILRDRIVRLYEASGESWLRTGAGLDILVGSLLQVDGVCPANTC